MVYKAHGSKILEFDAIEIGRWVWVGGRLHGGRIRGEVIDKLSGTNGKRVVVIHSVEGKDVSIIFGSKPIHTANDPKTDWVPKPKRENAVPVVYTDKTKVLSNEVFDICRMLVDQVLTELVSDSKRDHITEVTNGIAS